MFYLEPEVPQTSREQWLRAVRFTPLSNAEVLEQVLENVRRRLPSERPYVVFDLDLTLYDVRPRTLAIYGDWLSSAPQAESIRVFLERLSSDDLSYSVWDNLEKAGADLKSDEIYSAGESLYRHWSQLFFGENFLSFDEAYPGAVEFVQSIRTAGARVLYLTGRERSKMQRGTLQTLKRDGFPLDEQSFLLMREFSFFNDVEHKVGTLQKWVSRGHAVASFENEPRNLIAIRRLLPEALHVFVDTVCSSYAAHVADGLHRIRGFTRD